MRPSLFMLAAAVVFAGCSDSVPGPGTLVATVVSPNLNEGAAVVSVSGPGITGATGIGGSQVFSQAQGDGLRVVVVADPAAVLRFGLQVSDTTAEFTTQLLEVAGPTDGLRGALAEYAVEITR